MIDSSDSSDSSISKTLMTTDSFIETNDDGKNYLLASVFISIASVISKIFFPKFTSS